MADESLIFYVSYFPSGVLSVEGNGCYVLLNETNVNWGVGRTIEPFNVIFDTAEPTQTTLNGSEDINSIALTNSPVLTAEDPPQGGTFILDQNTIGMTRTTTTTPEIGGIISINGVTPQDGNINIKVLGGAGNG